MDTTLSALAPVLQDRFEQQVLGKVRDLVETIFNAVMQQEQLFFLGCLPYERSAQRRGCRNRAFLRLCSGSYESAGNGEHALRSAGRRTLPPVRRIPQLLSTPFYT